MLNDAKISAILGCEGNSASPKIQNNPFAESAISAHTNPQHIRVKIRTSDVMGFSMRKNACWWMMA